MQVKSLVDHAVNSGPTIEDRTMATIEYTMAAIEAQLSRSEQWQQLSLNSLKVMANMMWQWIPRNLVYH